MMEFYFKDKIEAIRQAMAGYPGFPATQKAMAERIEEDPANFNNMLNGRKPIRPEKLARLHQALGLETLGIPFDWWTERPAETFAAAIRDARRADPLEAMAGRLEPEAFFGFSSEIEGARIVKGMTASPAWERVRQKPVLAGEELRLQVTPPMDGFLKLLVIEADKVAAMDAHFGLSHARLRAGEPRTFAPILEVDAASPEALFVGLMQAERFGGELPRDIPSPHPVNIPPRLAEWLRGRLESGPELKIAAVRLFLSEGANG